MTGNDMVDLKQASRDSNWNRKGYLNKVFTIAEQQLIAGAVNPDEMVWLLWSMKEAVYKIHNRRTAIREYAPLKLNCQTKAVTCGSWIGSVQIEGNIYHTKSTVLRGNYIHTHAAENEQELAFIKQIIYLNALNINYKAMVPACVSHHGKYLALIF